MHRNFEDGDDVQDHGISASRIERGYDNRTDNDSQSVGSRQSLRIERKRLDQHSRDARLNFRKGSPLGLTIEVFIAIAIKKTLF